MLFSYLKIGFNIGMADVQIYEDDSGIEIPELEDRVLTLREEALKYATSLKEVYNLFRRGG
jgi:hypothetical protein